MKRFEIGRSIFPRRLTHSIDNKRSHHYYDTTNNQYRIPHGIATNRNLSRRDEAEDKRQQRTEEAQSTNQPHQAVSLATDAERTGHILQVVTQVDGSCKHQQIHDEVKQYGELRQDLVEALDRRHHHEEQAQQGHDSALNQEDVSLNTYFVGLLEERRQISRTPYSKDTFRRTGYPCQHTCQHTECQGDSDNR